MHIVIDDAAVKQEMVTQKELVFHGMAQRTRAVNQSRMPMFFACATAMLRMHAAECAS